MSKEKKPVRMEDVLIHSKGRKDVEIGDRVTDSLGREWTVKGFATVLEGRKALTVNDGRSKKDRQFLYGMFPDIEVIQRVAMPARKPRLKQPDQPKKVDESVEQGPVSAEA